MLELLGRLAVRFWATFARAPPRTAHFRVIGAGLPRTGTSSQQAALQHLLGGDVWHFESCLFNDAQHAGWRALSRARNDTLLRSLVAGFAGACDGPAAFHFEALMDVFPDAKVVLSLHPGGSAGWYASTMASIYDLQVNALSGLPIGRVPPFRGMRETGMATYVDCDASVALNQRRFCLSRSDWLDEAGSRAAYDAWADHVRAVVPRDRLLEFTVADGWAPLCDFLGVPEPEGTPFPNMNDRKKMRAFVLFLYVLNYGGAAVVLGGGLYAFRRRRVRRRVKVN